MRKIYYLLIFFIILHIVLIKTGYSENIVFDNFEYWDSPNNHGWITSDPDYPVFGMGVGYGNIETLLDFQEGSRVLNVQYTPSVFNRLEPYTLYNTNTINPYTGNYITNKIISVKIRPAFAIENFEMFQFVVWISTTTEEDFYLIYHTIDGPRVQTDDNKIHVAVGKEYGDGTWHLLICKLEEDLHEAFPQKSFANIKGFMLSGSNFRVDDIILRDDCNFLTNHPPELWHIGPQFASLFTPFSYLIAARDPDGDFLNFEVNVGGYGMNGADTNFSYRIKLPNDSSNPAYPINYDPNSNIVPPALIPFNPAEISDPGATITPNMAQIYFIPQTLDNLIVTVKVTDPGELSDTETFTLSVVNYPVFGMNHPPIIEDLPDCVVSPGTPFIMPILARDPDYNDILTYSATIDNLPSYQYGPWSEPLINPITGVINFVPQFEGINQISVTARDSRGMYATDTFIITIANKGTWLNHPPVMTDNIAQPQVATAGREFTLPIDFTDPDGEKLYYSTNIGTVTERSDGEEGITFHFCTHFPGLYEIYITAYDIRGGLTETSFILDVQPWWSF